MEITDNAKEAVKEMLRHVFEDCGMQKVWCGYYDGNIKSKRVQEKCGFVHYAFGTYNTQIGMIEDDETNILTRETWRERRFSQSVYSGFPG